MATGVDVLVEVGPYPAGATTLRSARNLINALRLVIPLLAANFSGLFEGLICVLFQGLFVLAVMVYLIRVFIKPPRIGWHGVPRRLAAFAVLSFASVMWAIDSNERSAEIALSYLRYLPIAPVGFALCLLAAQLSSTFRKRQNKAAHTTTGSVQI